MTGLLFVAVSINVERILRYRGLPERGLETLLVLLGVVVSTLGLVPGQGRAALGGEVLAAGLLCAGGVALLVIHNWPPPGERKYLASHLVLISPGAFLPAVGGASLLAGTGGGLYWVLAGILGAFVGGVVNAWVLLVEILR